MRTALSALGLLTIMSLTGCVTTGIVAVVPDDNYSYQYYTGTEYVLINPDDYYYQSEGHVHRVRHHVDVVINYVPSEYIIQGWVNIPYNHRQQQMTHSQPRQQRHQDMRSPRGGYGQPAIQNPNHRTDTRQRVPQEMKPPVRRQTQPQQHRQVQQPQVRQQRSAPQHAAPPVVRQAPRQIQHSAPQRIIVQPQQDPRMQQQNMQRRQQQQQMQRSQQQQMQLHQLQRRQR